jgi:GNAT superfamily N-acetyltransferase
MENNLLFELLDGTEFDKINKVYDILKEAGEYMLDNYGLYHWKTPYPHNKIISDCMTKKVYLVSTHLNNKIYVGTFQIDIHNVNNERVILINKFATSHNYFNKGIGKSMLMYIEELAFKDKIKELTLDVYDKSIYAINFYKKNGFDIIREKNTKYFVVLEMKKNLK